VVLTVQTVSLGANAPETAQTSRGMGSGGDVGAATGAAVGIATGVYFGACQTNPICGTISTRPAIPSCLMIKMLMLRRRMRIV
jgi:hypothetical protein